MSLRYLKAINGEPVYTTEHISGTKDSDVCSIIYIGDKDGVLMKYTAVIEDEYDANDYIRKVVEELAGHKVEDEFMNDVIMSLIIEKGYKIEMFKIPKV